MEKTIYRFYNIERNRCITLQEFTDLLNEFKFGHHLRLAFALLGCCGMRSGELVKITLNDIGQDFRTIRYFISKKHAKKYKSGTETIEKPYCIRPLPEWLSNELKAYVTRNHHVFKEGRLFPYETDSLRRALCKLRVKARKGKLKSSSLSKALLETTGESLAFGVMINSNFRITLHSFRRFFTTLEFNTDWKRDLATAQRKMGHAMKETTMIYLYQPQNVGLTDELIGKKGLLNNIKLEV